MRFLLTVFLGLFLSACQAPDLRSFHVNTMKNNLPLALNVGTIRVDSEVMHYDRKPHIEKTLPVSPEEALTEWAENRFQAINTISPVKMIITISKADMTERAEKGANWYTLDNYTYRLTYQVNMKFEQNGTVLYQHSVDGWESSSLPQRSSLADKEAAWLKMMNAMIRKVNQQMTAAIPARFQAD